MIERDHHNPSLEIWEEEKGGGLPCRIRLGSDSSDPVGPPAGSAHGVLGRGRAQWMLGGPHQAHETQTQLAEARVEGERERVA
jgi:hypothetical protein